MNFGNALQALECKKRVARKGWNGKNMWLKVQFPDENSLMDGPYIYISNPAGKKFPWNPSQQDLFANDWTVVEDED